VFTGIGEHPITAVSSGDAALSGSTSPTLMLSVYDDALTPQWQVDMLNCQGSAGRAPAAGQTNGGTSLWKYPSLRWPPTRAGSLGERGFEALIGLSQRSPLYHQGPRHGRAGFRKVG
jgi:hypothetical protein